MYDIYSNTRNDSWRFALGKSGKQKLITIGLNPSTATKEKSDTTVAKVEEVARLNGFDGFVMLNLYPVRGTDYTALPHIADPDAFSENLMQIEITVALERQPVVWAAWGDSIEERRYFVAAGAMLVARLQNYGVTWQHFGPLTQAGHPRHPSRLKYAWNLSPLDINTYRKKLPK
jgi:hypothetical protein